MEWHTADSPSEGAVDALEEKETSPFKYKYPKKKRKKAYSSSAAAKSTKQYPENNKIKIPSVQRNDHTTPPVLLQLLLFRFSCLLAQ